MNHAMLRIEGLKQASELLLQLCCDTDVRSNEAVLDMLRGARKHLGKETKAEFNAYFAEAE